MVVETNSSSVALATYCPVRPLKSVLAIALSRSLASGPGAGAVESPRSARARPPSAGGSSPRWASAASAACDWATRCCTYVAAVRVNSPVRCARRWSAAVWLDVHRVSFGAEGEVSRKEDGP